ncbi:MAG: Glycosyl transferase family 2 [Candidatus Roizmanbacteria bacterium GW2011_GWA2_36_23]|uniref:Glycosyl transferase family 2 n=1 Tax=Candidatus Roizmanbacteria bacterium GW2011_GWA2_36_23 TaxID=1618480 RepID=A0A0G0GQ92_9BACT|nr:MAG: Glycosyl transferase family 2 [Candidatus Roizmanbacteria bacterium GW2011_GWA2_36_23]
MLHDSTEFATNSLAVITVVYQNYSILEDFFESLRKQNNKNFRLFISDLSDDKKEIKTGLPSTTINSGNNGYAHGVNLGLKKALEQNFKYFCVINNDILLDKEFIHNAINSITRNPSSVIGGKIYYAPGYEYHKNSYKKNAIGKVIWYAGGKVDWNHALTPHRGVDELDTGKYDMFEETDFVNGCLMCFDKKVADQVGLWDEKYFMYFEDSDYCQRAKKKGVKLYYDPSIVIWHKNAQSTGGSGSKLHQEFQEKSRLRFALKYAPIKTKIHVLINYILAKSK